MVKRVLSLIIAMVMILGMAGAAFAEGETAPAETEPVATEAPEASQEWLDYLKEKNYVTGYEDGTMGLEKNITRAEMATILVRAKDKQSAADGLKGVPSRFSDMYVGHWANGYVNLAVGDNIIKGYTNGKFMPARNISNAEAVTMIVRATGVLTKAEDDLLNANYPYSYINKAKEIGLLKGVNIANFQEMATRENVFKMVYNYLMDEEYGEHTVVKGIFIENNRTESLLAADEMTLEVMVLEQRANYVKDTRSNDSKYARGTNLKLTIPAKLGDVEDLLGKVVYVTLDNRLSDRPESVVKIKVDDTYDYLFGEASHAAKTFKVAGKSYTVELDEGYAKHDERLFRTYRNNVDLTYVDFDSVDYKKDDKYPIDFARATIKNGKVVFIDSFKFDDIAPVESRRATDNAIMVYSDNSDGRIELLAPRKYVIGFAADKFTRLDPANIKEKDVIHAYGNGGIVRTDALVQGKFQHVLRTDQKVYAVLEGEGLKFRIFENGPRRAVYSTGAENKNTDGVAFKTLEVNQAASVLHPFQGKDVTLLKDIFNHMQYIQSGFEFTDNTALVHEVLSRGAAKFLRRDNTFANLNEDWRTVILDNNLRRNPIDFEKTIAKQLTDLNRADLVYTVGEQDKIINVLVRIATYGEMIKPYDQAANFYGYATVLDKDTNMIVVQADGKAYKENITDAFQRGAANDRTIYSVLPRTNVFFVEPNRTALRAGSISGVAKGNKVVVISDNELGAILDTTRAFDPGMGDNRARHYYNAYTNRNDIANTIVVLDTTKRVGDSSEIIKLDQVVSYTPDTKVLGFRADNAKEAGKTYENSIYPDRYDYLRRNTLLNLTRGDIYEFWTIDAAGKKIVDVTPVITNNKTFIIRRDNIAGAYDFAQGTSFGSLLLEDANGDKFRVWLDKDVAIFGRLTPDRLVRLDNDTELMTRLTDKEIGTLRVNPREIYRTEFRPNVGFSGFVTAIEVVEGTFPTANKRGNEYKILGFGTYGAFGYGPGYSQGTGFNPVGAEAYVDVYPYNKADRDALARFRMDVQAPVYYGVAEVYRIPLLDARFVKASSETPAELAVRYALTQKATGAASVELKFDFDYNRNVVMLIDPNNKVLGTTPVVPGKAEYDTFRANNGTTIDKDPATVVAGDKAAIEKARADYNALPAEAKALAAADEAKIVALEKALDAVLNPADANIVVTKISTIGGFSKVTIEVKAPHDITKVTEVLVNGTKLAHKVDGTNLKVDVELPKAAIKDVKVVIDGKTLKATMP